jgi:hypothetical protein
MRKTALALLAAAALSLGTISSPAAADTTQPQACLGQLVSFGVQNFGPGRRVVADTFVGDYPRAVQDVQGLAQAFCSS